MAFVPSNGGIGGGGVGSGVVVVVIELYSIYSQYIYTPPWVMMDMVSKYVRCR